MRRATPWLVTVWLLLLACGDRIDHGTPPTVGWADGVTGVGDTTDLPPGLYVTAVEIADGKSLPGSSYHRGSGNGDGSANRGESVALRVTLYNAQGLQLKNVEGTLRQRAAHPCVANITDNRGDFGTLEGGEVTDATSGGPHFEVEIAPTCTPPADLIFLLGLEDGEGRTWEAELGLTVSPTAAHVVYRDVEVADGRRMTGSTYYVGSGNGDGIINRSESIALRVQLVNDGQADTQGVSGTLSSADGCVVVTDREASFGDIAMGNGEGGTRTTDFTFDVLPACAGPQVISFSLELEDRYGNRWTGGFSLQLVPIDVAMTVQQVELADGRTLPGNSYHQGSGDGDGVPEEGERVGLRVTLRNSGASSTRSLDGRISTDAGCLVISDADGSFGDVEGLGSTLADGGAHFSVEVGTACAGAHTMELALDDLYGNTFATSFVFRVP